MLPLVGSLAGGPDFIGCCTHEGGDWVICRAAGEGQVLSGGLLAQLQGER